MDGRDQIIVTLAGKVYGLEAALQAAITMLLTWSVKDPLQAGKTGDLSRQMVEALAAGIRNQAPTAGSAEMQELFRREAIGAVERSFDGAADLLDIFARFSLDAAAPETGTKN